MYKQEHIDAAADFLEKYALGTCDSEQEIINTFIKVMPELAAEYNFDKDYEICDLLASPEVTQKADVIRCVNCWWFVRLSECADEGGELLCEDCTND